jgi:hypothetical protein
MRHIDLSLSSVLDRLLNEDMVKRSNKPVGNYYSTVTERLKDAIKFRRFISLNYDDRKGDKGTVRNPDGSPKWGNPRAYRRLIPYALYISNQNGELTLRCFHYSSNHTKRGPERWKEMVVNKMKNVRILKAEFSEEDLPSNINKEGDKHAAHLITMVDFRRNPQSEEDVFVSPLERERMRYRNDKKGFSSEDLYTNQQGPVKQVVPNVKTGRNLKTMRNLGKPGEIDYSKAYDAFKNSNGSNALRDWDRAEAERAVERNDQQTQQNRPVTPVQNDSGPVNTRRNVNDNEDEENWDEYLNRPNNNNF